MFSGEGGGGRGSNPKTMGGFFNFLVGTALPFNEIFIKFYNGQGQLFVLEF